VLVYGDYGMKSDFGGWQNHHSANLYAMVCSCYGEGANDSFTDNTCVVRDGGGCYFWPHYSSDCATRAGPPAPGLVTRNNSVYTHDGNVTVCEEPHKPGGKYTLTEWVAMGHDPHSSMHRWPTDLGTMLVTKARSLLGLQVPPVQ
jgi:hypothetical protein